MINEGTLDFALSQSKSSTDWIKELAMVIRSIILDHVFEDGNKRTASIIIAHVVEYKGYKIKSNDIARVVLRTTSKGNLRRTYERLQNAIYR